MKILLLSLCFLASVSVGICGPNPEPTPTPVPTPRPSCKTNGYEHAPGSGNTGTDQTHTNVDGINENIGLGAGYLLRDWNNIKFDYTKPICESKGCQLCGKKRDRKIRNRLVCYCPGA